MSLIPLGILASAGGKASSFESIASQTVGSGGAASITFSSIPSTYTHLQVRMIIRGTASGNTTNVYAQYNSDTGANYTFHLLRGDGASATATGVSGTTVALGDTSAASATANAFGAGIMDILDYTNTNKYKTLRYLNGYDANGNGIIGLDSSLWLNTSAISSIQIFTNGGNIAEYSTFALYGIKGA